MLTLSTATYFCFIISISTTAGDGRLCFRWRQYVGRYNRYIGIYVCEQLPGANSSPIVTKLRHSYRLLATGDEVIKFWKVKVKGKGRWGGMRSTERLSSYNFCSF